MKLREAFSRFKSGYIQFAEKQGFAVITTICVGVITATALWTGQQEEPYIAPTPPPPEGVSAAQLMQQSLRSAVTESPMPTNSPSPWHAPLEEISILRAYDTATMVQGDMSGIWYVHNAVDLAAESGSRVYSMADGVVVGSGKDQLLGGWLTIDHGDGIEALYAGLSLTDAYIAGDKVFAGDPIGFTGNGVWDETGLGAHLHLRVTQDGQPVDPASLWGHAARQTSD